MVYLGRLGDLHLAIWILVTVVGVGAYLVARGRVYLTDAIPTMVVLSTAALVMSVVTFTWLHAHPLLQYNAESVQGVWGNWGLCCLICGLGLPIAGIWTIVTFLGRRAEGLLARREAVASGAALLQGVVAWVFVLQNFPSA
jgi:hypothetical protein